jgi:hypothetical protein
MPRLNFPCVRCRDRGIYEVEGGLTVKGGKFPEVVCQDCADVLREMNNPDMIRGRYLVGPKMIRLVKQEVTNGN